MDNHDNTGQIKGSYDSYMYMKAPHRQTSPVFSVTHTCIVHLLTIKAPVTKKSYS